MTISGETENPAAALANAVWGMREAVALSSTALKKAVAWAAGGGQSDDGGEPLALADIEPMSQQPWTHLPETSYKTVDLGEHVTGTPDKMDFYCTQQKRMDSPENDQVDQIAAEHGLSPAYRFGFSRTDPQTGHYSQRLTGGGKLGEVYSHVAHALDTFLTEKRPYELSFTALEPKRAKAYRQLMHYGQQKGIGDGEYRFLGSGIGGGAEGFAIVHKSVADLPRYERHYDLGNAEEPALAGEPVAASGATTADVLGARPISGRLAENMNTVAMANLPNTFDLQEKTIAPAIDYMGIDGPGSSPADLTPGMKILAELRARRRQAVQDQGYANLSPGQKVLYELRARGRAQPGGYGFANEPPDSETGLTPQQTMDVHTLSGTMQKLGGEATQSHFDRTMAWKAQSPNEPGEHANRMKEAIANAKQLGAIQNHPSQYGRLVPGPNYAHYTQPMQSPPAHLRGGKNAVPGTSTRLHTGRPSSITWPESQRTAAGQQFIQQSGMRQDIVPYIRKLVTIMQGDKGYASSSNIAKVVGWHQSPPLDPALAAKGINRRDEILGHALKHGVIAKQEGSQRYVPGPNYTHFLEEGEQPAAIQIYNPGTRNYTSHGRPNIVPMVDPKTLGEIHPDIPAILANWRTRFKT